MTGYGAAVVACDMGEFAVEVKTVNNRFLDLNLRLPREMGFLEMDLRDEVKRGIRRGKVDLFLRWTASPGAPALYEINQPLLRHYAGEARAALDLKPDAPVDLGALLQLPGTVNPTRATTDDTTLADTARAAVREAIGALDRARTAEGAALVTAIVGLLDEIAAMRAEMAGLKESLVEEHAQRLRERVAQIEKQAGVPLDAGRVEAEVLMYAEKADITEELVRLDAHLAAFRKLCANGAGEPVGKNMDFLVQELLRETNTIGNKARGLEVANRIVRMKGEIEKIREQVQNLE